MRILSLLLFLICVLISDARADTTTTPTIYFYVKEYPVFQGNISQYMSNALQYPESARENNIQGKVVIRYAIDSTGKTDSITVSQSADASLDSEAVRIIREMPRWQPGLQNGRPARVYYSQPVLFRLDGNQDNFIDNKPVVNMDSLSKRKQALEDSAALNYSAAPAFDWYSFVQKNMRTPIGKNRKDIKGCVYLQFHVDAKGKVTQVTIERSENPSFEKEAFRVASKIAKKKWKPGKVNGELAAYNCVLPFFYAVPEAQVHVSSGSLAPLMPLFWFIR